MLKPNITIAVLTHNRSWHFAQMLASIREYTTIPYVLKVLDTCSNLNHIEHVNQFRGEDFTDHILADKFYSCVEGRRIFLDYIDTEFTVYLDDDIRVGPLWLSSLMTPMINDDNTGIVASNIVQEGKRVTSGVRKLKNNGRSFSVSEHLPEYRGEGDLSLGGATLYRTEALRKTEYRKEFIGGYEDWDQTLQIKNDLNLKIQSSNATLFHYHMAESQGYFSDRWRWVELMDSALGIFDRWKIRTGVDKVLKHFIDNEITIPREQVERITEVLI